MNDPNGVVHWRGRYHVFYQHNPHAPRWGPPHWGHAVSDDLVRWQHLPVALTPDMPPVDPDGCWSGCLVDDDGTPTILYSTGRDGEQTVCLATGSTDLLRWRKHPGNPVAWPPPLAGRTLDAHRDPCVWREDGVWYALVGTSIGGLGQALLHRSDDLRKWTYLHPFVPAFSDAVCDDTGQAWECPSFFALGGEHVLLVSHYQWAVGTHANALIGRYRDHRFHPRARQRLDWGHRAFFAPLTLRDDAGRRLVWGWLPEQRDPVRAGADWAGVASLPRELTLERGVLHQRFVPELRALRGSGMRLECETQRGEREVGLAGPAVEVRCTLERDGAAASGLRFRHAAGQHSDVLIAWETGRLLVDTRWSKGPFGNELAFDTAPLAEAGETLERVTLHLYLDHSVLEVIARDRQALTARLYPYGPEDHAVSLVALGGPARVAEFEGWVLDDAA